MYFTQHPNLIGIWLCICLNICAHPAHCHCFYSRLVPSSPLRMTDPALKSVVTDIVRSPEDKRVYRGLEFNNGLRAMLISDPTTDKSSAALDVHIGKKLSTAI